MCFCIFSCIIFSASFASSIQPQSSQTSPNKSDTVSFSLQSRPFVHFQTNNVESFFPLTEHTMIEWNNEGLHTPSTELTSLMCWICIDWFNFALCFTPAIEVVFILFIFFFSWHKYILEKTNREKTAYQRTACTYENQDAHINTHNIKKIQTKGSLLFVCLFFTLMLLQHHGKVVIK